MTQLGLEPGLSERSQISSPVESSVLATQVARSSSTGVSRELATSAESATPPGACTMRWRVLGSGTEEDVCTEHSPKGFREWPSGTEGCRHPSPAPHRTKHLKHPKVRGFCRKLQVALWRATASHIPAHIHNTQRSGPDIKPDLLVLRPRAATGANSTPPPTRLNSLWKFTLIKVSARRQFTDHLIQGLYFREGRTEAQKGDTHILVRTWSAHNGGIQSPQAWPLSLDSTRLAAHLPTLRLVQQKGCFHLPRVFTPHQSVSYQLPNEPHTSILKATFRAGDEEASLFCLVPDTVSWILQILSKDQAKGFLKSRKMVQMDLFPG